MTLNRNELKNFLSERNLDDRNVDYFFRNKQLTTKQFADWEATLPNSLFPRLKEKQPPNQNRVKENDWW